MVVATAICVGIAIPATVATIRIATIVAAIHRRLPQTAKAILWEGMLVTAQTRDGMNSRLIFPPAEKKGEMRRVTEVTIGAETVAAGYTAG